MPNDLSLRRKVVSWKAVLVLAAGFALAPAAAGQNKVVNSGFDEDLAGWTEAPGSTNTVISWHPLDAKGSSGSGSARFENPPLATPRSLEQCLNVSPGALVRLSARYRLEGAGNGSAQILAVQYRGADCTGSPFLLSGSRQDGLVQGEWSSLSGTATLGPDFVSIALRIAVVGNGFSGHFDDVAVEELTGTCTPSPTALCLVGDRYRVESDWRTGTGSGQGQAAEIHDGPASGTGYFWFFDPANIEVVVKVLDACVPPFDRVWVFAGGLTNQEVELRVTDTLTGATWTHFNPLNQVWETVTDTQALGVCD